MATERLYQQDVYLKEADQKIVEIREEKGRQQVACERTVFFPEGMEEAHKVIKLAKELDFDFNWIGISSWIESICGRYIGTTNL